MTIFFGEPGHWKTMMSGECELDGVMSKADATVLAFKNVSRETKNTMIQAGFEIITAPESFESTYDSIANNTRICKKCRKTQLKRLSHDILSYMLDNNIGWCLAHTPLVNASVLLANVNFPIPV